MNFYLFLSWRESDVEFLGEKGRLIHFFMPQFYISSFYFRMQKACFLCASWIIKVRFAICREQQSCPCNRALFSSNWYHVSVLRNRIFGVRKDYLAKECTSHQSASL